MDYGYEGEALLMVPVESLADLEVHESVKIEATLKWLVCRETCIPERADLAENSDSLLGENDTAHIHH